MNTTQKILIASTLFVSLASTASAKDWIETVKLTKDGIDAVPIEVSADASGYTKIKSSGHRFHLNLHARATSGERIVAMKVGAFKGVLYFEGNGGQWSQSFANRDVGSGTKRTVSINFSPVVPTAKIAWQGPSPKQACEINLANQRAKGMRKSAVLLKTWTVSARAYFELDAVAARKNKAANNTWSIKNTTNQRDGMTYTVPVQCNAGLKKKTS
jgi:opacity protein-like surface antigen